MAALGPKISIARGLPVKLNSALIAGAGTIDFSMVQNSVGTDFSAVFHLVGTATGFAAALQISLDGGTTFTDYIAAASFLNAVAAPAIVKVVAATNPLIAGAIWRINVTAVAGGSSDLWMAMN